MKENKTYIALGSNLGNREQNLAHALKQMAAHIKITKKSSIYETDPVGYKNQGKFLNMVIEAETKLSPEKLLEELQKIEQNLGRTRTFKNAPRTIDLDILIFKNQTKNTKTLKIPHPEMHKRNFVLKPLSEIAPEITQTIKQ